MLDKLNRLEKLGYVQNAEPGSPFNRSGYLVSMAGPGEAFPGCSDALGELGVWGGTVLGRLAATKSLYLTVGKLFRPDNPLLPNYKWIPIGNHGRSSSIGISGQQVLASLCRGFGAFRGVFFHSS